MPRGRRDRRQNRAAMPIPATEKARLAHLYELELLDSGAEPAYDAFTRLASAICATPVSLITLVDRSRQWFKSNVGLDGWRETSLDAAFCRHTVQAQTLLEIPDAHLDERFRSNPLVLREPRIRFYAGMPIVVGNAHAVGTLCVMDRVARTLTERQREELRLLAAGLRGLIESRVSHKRLQRYEAQLRLEKRVQKRVAKLSYEASHDGLTDLYNRRQFEHCLRVAIDTAKSDGRVHTLTYLDLDHFKPINDRYGHAAGDCYLAELARQLRKTLRGNDVLARIGGDEFGFIMHDCTLENARPVLAALEKTVELLKVAWQNEKLSVGVSYGTVEIDARTANVQNALHAADTRCYAAKKNRLTAV